MTRRIDRRARRIVQGTRARSGSSSVTCATPLASGAPSPSVKLAALVLVGVPATLIPILLLGRRVRRLSRDNQDRVADVSAHIDESIHEIRTVQAYAHEAQDRSHFAERVEAAFRSGVARVHQKAWLIALVMFIAFSAVAVILWIGGHDVIAGSMTVGELSAFVFYAGIVAALRNGAPPPVDPEDAVAGLEIIEVAQSQANA